MFLRAVSLAGLITTAAIIAAQAARLGWPFEMIANLLPMLCAAALLSGALLLSFRWRIIGATAFAAGFLGVASLAGAMHAMPRAPLVEPSSQNAEQNDLTIIWCNLLGNMDAAARVALLAQELDADVVALSEMPSGSFDQVVGLFSGFPYTIYTGDADIVDGPAASRTAMLSRRAFRQIEIHEEPDWARRPFIRAELNLNESVLALVAAHPRPPSTEQKFKTRDGVISAVSQAVSQHERYVVMGDFNVTPWSPSFHRLPGVRAGDPRLESTWLTRWPGLGLPIDHIMLGDQVELLSYRIGPRVGSDHLPLIARIRLKPSQ